MLEKRLKVRHGLLVLLLGALAVWQIGSTSEPSLAFAATAASCGDHPDQAAAQRAKDTRDADGDGVYCESLPCPCLAPDARGVPDSESASRGARSCTRPDRVKRLVFSRRQYPNIRRHFRRAVRDGWPRLLVLSRPGADARRDRLLEGIPTRAGQDRDEYPPAVGRGKGWHLERGRNPRGWKASVRYVPSSENRSHGAAMGNMLERFCNGTRFRYVFR
jgi:hypothetical protein